jgi:hypothetical protein
MTNLKVPDWKNIETEKFWRVLGTHARQFGDLATAIKFANILSVGENRPEFRPLKAAVELCAKYRKAIEGGANQFWNPENRFDFNPQVTPRR